MRAWRTAALLLVVACSSCAGDASRRAPGACAPPTPPVHQPPVPRLDAARTPPDDVRARARCPAGRAWNGAWCGDPALEAATAAYFARIDGDIRARFGPDQDLFAYQGVAEEIVGTRSAPGRFDRDLLEADRYADRLDAFAEGNSSPKWRAVAFARKGSLYYGLWVALDLSLPQPRHAQAAELQGLARPSEVPSKAHSPLLDAWNVRKGAALASVSRLAGVVLCDRRDPRADGGRLDRADERRGRATQHLDGHARG